LPGFPGVVQFSVSVFSASTFPKIPPVVEICHFAGPPEAPTATADVAGGIPGRRPRTRTATVRKLARSPRRLRHFPAGRSPKPRISYSVEYATTRLRGTRIFFAGVRKYHYPPLAVSRPQCSPSAGSREQPETHAAGSTVERRQTRMLRKVAEAPGAPERPEAPTSQLAVPVM
jgi:hypothetical protein